jgi:hypothetical protein
VTPLSSLRFSSNGKSLFYLMRDSPRSVSELWRTNLESGRSEAVLRGVSIMEYNVSSDGREVVFSTWPSGKAPQIWRAPLDRRSPPQLITGNGGAWPVFGPDGQVLFQWSDGTANYLVRIGTDGSSQSKVVPYPIGNVLGISPDRRWMAIGMPLPDRSTGNVRAVSTAGGESRLICPGACPVQWAPDGRFFYVGVEYRSLSSAGRTVAIPIPPGKTLPELPVSGIRGPEDVKAFPGARLLEGWDIAPGPDPSVFAYTKTTVHRNLYRIPVP